MTEIFTTEFDDEDGEEQPTSAQNVPLGSKNYITPAGFRRLQDELDQLWKVERPALVQTITWAASNGLGAEKATQH